MSVPGRPAGSTVPDGSAVGWLAAIRCLALDEFAAATSTLLTAAGIPNLLLKGPATAGRLYPDRPELRTYTDVDLLVRVDRFDAAQDVLRYNGYRWLLAGVRDGEFPWHEAAWQAPGPAGLALDLHRGFAGALNAAAFFDELWSTRDGLELCGVLVAVPSLSGTALILSLHAASPGRGRKPLSDIVRAHEVFDGDVWRQAAGLARTCGADSAFRAGIGLLPDGAGLADVLGIGGTVATDQWLGGRQFGRVSVNLAAALSEPHLTARIGYLVRHMLPSPAFLRLSSISARRGFGWLLLAYGRRIGTAFIAAPEAFADVATARRAVRPRSGRSILVRISRIDRRSLRVAGWAWLVHHRVRGHLRTAPLVEIDLTGPPFVRSTDRAAVLAVMRVTRATCLERSLVIQRFDAAAGRPRDLIIAVTGAGDGFRAHAWLAGDRQSDGALNMILRRAPRETWSATGTLPN